MKAVSEKSVGVCADNLVYNSFCEALAELHKPIAQAVHCPKLSSLFTLLTSHFKYYLQHFYFNISKRQGQGQTAEIKYIYPDFNRIYK